jgi:ribonuclease BN (tRNA processing enzyme)
MGDAIPCHRHGAQDEKAAIMKLTFVGCGDAFGSGGRFNTCFHVEADTAGFLVDCGASSLIALKRMNIDRTAIGTILITHFHGDHFGGIPYFMLDAQFSKRNTALTIAGPAGLRSWYERVMETAFPGSSRIEPKFALELRELAPGETCQLNGLTVTAASVRHGQPEHMFLAYRIAAGGKTIAYTGDTEWTDSLIEIGREADLLIAEAYFYSKKVPLHLDLATLEEKLPLIKPKRLILTHMSEDMLRRAAAIHHETAEDGLLIEV